METKNNNSSYNNFTLRNTDYIAEKLQNKIRTSTILIAGCGIGSQFAEVAVRLGFENLILADADTVSEHNLNRQSYTHNDIGKLKVEALTERLKAINPHANIRQYKEYITEENAAYIVKDAQIVFDTIDFLDLSGIVSLHDECVKQKKHIISAIAVGWGAGCIYFPPGTTCSIRKLFSLPEFGSVKEYNYSEVFSTVFASLAAELDPEVINAVSKALTIMEDGKPCPASQVAPGAYAVAAFAGTLVVRLLAGQPVSPSPDFLLMDTPKYFTKSTSIDLLNNSISKIDL